jgi:hypothetical protein
MCGHCRCSAVDVARVSLALEHTALVLCLTYELVCHVVVPTAQWPDTECNLYAVECAQLRSCAMVAQNLRVASIPDEK